MEFKRNVKFDSEQTRFEMDNTFVFEMSDGEKVKARAIQ